MLGRSEKASFAAVPARLPPNRRSARSDAGLDTPRHLRIFTWGFIGIIFVASVVLGTRESAITLIALAIGALVIGVLVLLGQDALLAGLVISLNILIDFFQLVPPPLRLPVIATVIATFFLVIRFLWQSPERPWISVPRFWWWILLLVLALLPTLRGGLLQGGRYYVTVLLNGLLLYMLGIQVARDIAALRRLFLVLAGFASFIALHAILQGLTQNPLLLTHYWDSYLISVDYFRLAGSQAMRAGSFFINPDTSGAFLAMMIFIPVGLFLESSSRFFKGLYVAGTALILFGLFFTYSVVSFAAAGAGLIVFILLSGQGRSRFYALGVIGALVLGAALLFPSRLHSLIAHASAPNELSIRLGAWETGIRVILAHPLTGLGLSFYTYKAGAEAYRVRLQTIPLAHPHNSFLEIAALGGVPVLAAFLLVWGGACWLAWQNYRAIEKKYQPLLGGGMTAILIVTLNGLATNTWTNAALVAVSWLILGTLASPALRPAPSARKLLENRSSPALRLSQSAAQAREGA